MMLDKPLADSPSTHVSGSSFARQLSGFIDQFSVYVEAVRGHADSSDAASPDARGSAKAKDKDSASSGEAGDAPVAADVPAETLFDVDITTVAGELPAKAADSEKAPASNEAPPPADAPPSGGDGAALDAAAKQSETEDYKAASSTDYSPAFDGFENIEQPGKMTPGFIRYTVKGGRKFYLKESVNPEMFAELSARYDDQEKMKTLPDHKLVRSTDKLPGIDQFNDVIQIHDLDEGLLAFETNEGTVKGIVSQDHSPNLYTEIVNLQATLKLEKHTAALKKLGPDVTLVRKEAREPGEIAGVPSSTHIRTIELQETSDGGKVLLYTTEENKQFAVSNMQTPGMFETVLKLIEPLGAVQQLMENGYSLVKEMNAPLPDVRDIKNAGWEEGESKEVTGYELKNGDKKSVTAFTNPDLYAHIQGVNEFLKSPKEHQDAVNKLRDDGGMTLADAKVKPFPISDIDSIEFVSESERVDDNSPELSDPRTGIITFKDRSGKQRVVSERLTPVLFEDLRMKKEILAQIDTFRKKGYEWASEETPPVPLGAKIEVEPVGDPQLGISAVTVDGKKYLVSSEQMTKEQNDLLAEKTKLEQAGAEIPAELAAKIQSQQGLPFLSSASMAMSFQGLDPALQEKLKNIDNGEDFELVKSNSPLPTQQEQKTYALLNQITSYNMDDAQSGIIYYTKDGKDYAVSRDIAPNQYATIEDAVKSKDGFTKSLSEGYREAKEGDYKLTITEVSAIGEFGSATMRFTTDEGEKIVVSAKDDPYLYNEAANAYAEKQKEELEQLRQKYDLPPKSETSIGLALIDTKEGKKTVQSEAYFRLYTEYKTLYDQGKLKESDPRYRFIRLISAQTTLQSGMSILPYIEDDEARLGNDTVRKFKLKDKQQDFVKLTSADMAELIDGRKLENELASLFAEGTIATDMQAKTNDVITQHIDKKDFINNIIDQINSTDFTQAMADLALNGKESAIAGFSNEMLQTVAMLAPERLPEIQQMFVANTSAALIERKLRDPASIAPENAKQAQSDVVDQIVTGRILPGIADAAESDPVMKKTSEYFANDGNAEKVKGCVNEVMDLIRNSGGEWDDDTIAKFVDEKVANKELDKDDKDAVNLVLGMMVGNGFFKAAESMTQIAASYYDISKGAAKVGADPASRINNVMAFSTNVYASPVIEKKTRETIDATFALTKIGEPEAKDDLDKQNLRFDSGEEATISEDEKHTSSGGQANDHNAGLAYLNHPLVNIGSGLMEGVNSIPILVRGDLHSSFYKTLSDMKKDVAGYSMTLAGGMTQFAFGLGQAATGAAAKLNSVLGKVAPAISRAHASMMNPAAPVTNAVLASSSVLFGLGMMFMGLAAQGNKNMDDLRKGVMWGMFGVGTAIVGSGVAQAASIPLTAATASAEAAQIAAETTGAALSGMNKAALALGPVGRALQIGGFVAGIGGGLIGGALIGGIMGGLQMKDGIKNGDDWMTAGGAATIASSVGMSVGMGALMAGSIATGAATLGLSLLVMLPAIAIMAMLDEIRGNPVFHKINAKEDATFDEIDKDGLLRPEAREKLEYLRYFTYTYGGREELKDDESFIETQNPMWEHFRKTPQSHGTSKHRLEDDLLVDLNNDGNSGVD
jgi:hypothetical protein